MAMKWKRFPKNEKRRQEWIAMISNGRENFHPGKWTYVCSTHFRDGKPITRYPNPSMFLTKHDELWATPKKRRSPAKRKTENVKIRKLNGNQVSVSPSAKFTDLTREYDIRFYTGLIDQDNLRTLFEFLKLKASTMTYWDENKKTIKSSSFESKLENLLSSPEIDPEKLNYAALKSGPSRKLSRGTEFLLVLMKLRLDLLEADLAYRFDVSPGKVP